MSLAVQTPVWGDAAHTFIQCQVSADNGATWHPYTANAATQVWALIDMADVGPYAAPAAPPLPQLSAALLLAASNACAALTAQVVPDATHQNAYLNAAAMAGPAAAVPSADPAKTAFANLAQAVGQPPAAFAATVVAVASASLALSAALFTLQQGVATATSAQQLVADLAAFETALSAVEALLAAAGIAVTAPPAISIAGINA